MYVLDIREYVCTYRTPRCRRRRRRCCYCCCWHLLTLVSGWSLVAVASFLFLFVSLSSPRIGGWGVDGWEQERLGEVRDFPSIRKMFMQIPAEFCSKVICAGVSSRDPSALDFAAMPTGDVMGGGPGGGGKGSLSGEAVLTEASRLLTATVKPGAVFFFFSFFLVFFGPSGMSCPISHHCSVAI